jgi:Ser/Thr protein kinase RdoA (MazF antagonist)
MSVENFALETEVLEFARRAYAFAPGSPVPLSGGHFTRVYEFVKDGRAWVLRVTPPDEEIDLASTRAVLAWMAHLADGGAAVPRPLPSASGALIETWAGPDGPYLLVVFEKAGGVLAEDLDFNCWDSRLFRSLGQATGRMHTLAKDYAPALELRRPDWNATANCYHPGAAPAGSEPAVSAARQQALLAVAGLPRGRDGWGLIHADLHGGNLMVDQESGQVTIIDFDDCCCGWYGMDLAMSLLDLTVLYPGPDKDAFARRFMASYLPGYLSENDLSPFWAAQLPRFLKLLETGLYLMVHPMYDPQDNTGWIGRFMAGRKARIENHVPYLSVDFGKLLEAAR